MARRIIGGRSWPTHAPLTLQTPGGGGGGCGGHGIIPFLQAFGGVSSDTAYLPAGGVQYEVVVPASAGYRPADESSGGTRMQRAVQHEVVAPTMAGYLADCRSEMTASLSNRELVQVGETPSPLPSPPLCCKPAVGNSPPVSRSIIAARLWHDALPGRRLARHASGSQFS